MKTAKHSSGIGGLQLLAALAVAAVTMAAVAPVALADPPGGPRVTVTGPAGIQVWVDNTYDVFPSYNDVVISIHAHRSCYATVFVVDTYGFVHVIHPFSPYESAWIRGGVVYRFSGRDLGLEVLGGRGIAHVFAVSSPYPFDYSPYGEAIFVGRYGYRVYGDPYVGCRQLYISILPAGFHRGWDFVEVGFARFYVREWARYPAYLCHGYHGGAVHVRVGGRCQHCYSVYESYRVHVNDPHVAMRSTPRYKDAYAKGRTQIARTKGVDGYKDVVERNRTNSAVKRSSRSWKIVSAKRTDQTVAVKKARAAKQTKTTVKKTATTRQTSADKRAGKTTPAKKSRVTKAKIQKGQVSR